MASNWFKERVPLGATIVFQRGGYSPVLTGVVEGYACIATALVRVDGEEELMWVNNVSIIEISPRPSGEVNNDNS